MIVGYTPGYYGTVLAPTGVVVYGTGYVYPPVYWGSLWYPPPATYGFGAGFFWGSVTGFAFGAAAGAIWGGAWGHYGGYGSYTSVHINNFNSYNHWNSNQVHTNVQRNYNRDTGRVTPQQRQQAQRDYNKRTGQLTRSSASRPSRITTSTRVSSRRSSAAICRAGHRRGPTTPSPAKTATPTSAAPTAAGSTRQRRLGRSGFQRWRRIGGRPRPAAAGSKLWQLVR